MNIYQLYPKSLKDVILTLPCSKSVLNRIISLSVYFDVSIKIENVILSIDIQTCLDSIEKLGISVVYHTESQTLYLHRKSNTRKENIHIDAGPSGTTLRFMTALAPFLSAQTYIDGDYSLKKRPVQDLLDVLEQQLGVQVMYHEKQGYLPFTLIPSVYFPKTKHLTVSAEKSSQFASALLMILPYLGIGAMLTLIPPVHSLSYVELTVQVMRQLGFEIVKTEEFTYSYKGRTIPQQEIIYPAEADWSAATFWYGYTALSGKKATLCGLNPNSTQGECNIMQIMQKMGIHSQYNEKNELEIFPSQSSLLPIDVDLTLLPDAAPMLAVLCAFAQGKSTLNGLQTLVYKETNRIQALAQELHKMNVHTENTHEHLVIYGTKQMHSAVIETYNDHRIAMAFAMAGVRVPYLSIIDPDCVQKSYAQFWQDYKKTGMLILPRKTVI